jgi:hypothetical protein
LTVTALHAATLLRAVDGTDPGPETAASDGAEQAAMRRDVNGTEIDAEESVESDAAANTATVSAPSQKNEARPEDCDRGKLA